MRHLDGAGLALAGGGWRAFSQVAVLEDMERHGVRVGAVAGTSMGSLVATLVAAGLPAARVEELLLSLDRSIDEAGIVANMRRHLLSALTKQGFITSEVMIEQIDRVLTQAGIRRFSDLAMPLALCSVDLLTGELVVFTGEEGLFSAPSDQWTVEAGDHDLACVIAASASYPVAVTPMGYLGHTLVDGACRMNLPTPLFDRSLVDAVVGVSMIRDHTRSENPSILSIMGRCMDYGATQLDLLYSQAADVAVNFPLPGHGTFGVGEGAAIIQAARDQLATDPVDWAPARPSLFHSMGRAAVDSVSRFLRGRASQDHLGDVRDLAS